MILAIPTRSFAVADSSVFLATHFCCCWPLF